MKNLYLLFSLIFFQFGYSQISLPYLNNFNNPASDEGWSHYSISGSDNWERGADNSTIVTDLSWNTALNDSPDSNSIMVLESPAFDLTNASLPYVLSFKYKSNLSSGNLYLEYTLDNGNTWSLLNPNTNLKRTWQDNSGFLISFNGARFPALNLSSLAGNANVKFRFKFKTNLFVNGFGCIIDDFKIQPEYYNIHGEIGETIEISPLCPKINTLTDLNFSNQYTENYNLETNYYLSVDTQLDVSDTFLGTKSSTVNSSDSMYDFEITTPTNLSPGQYYIIYKHDFTNVVDEDNETDNTGYAPLLVKPIFSLPYQTDFETADINWQISENHSGIEIWERGEGNRHHIEKSHSGSYAWHTSKSLNQHPNSFFQSVESPYFNLSSENNPIILSFWYKAHYPAGVGYYDNEYTVQYSLDCSSYWQDLYTIPENLSDEWEFVNIPLDQSISSNENIRFRVTYHNMYLGPEGIIFDDFYLGAMKPDISIERIFSNHRFTSSNNYTDVLTYQIRNSGEDLSQGITTNFYWSNDEVLDSNDIFLGGQSSSALNGNNQGEWLGFSYTKPNQTEGDYFIIYEIDPTNTLDEIREYNNTGAIPIEQTPTFNFPYSNNFENSVTGWKHTSTLGVDEWELATAQGEVLDEVFSGNKAFITKPSGGVSSMSRMHLYTPIFDLSSSVNPVLEFDMKLDNYVLCSCYEFTMNVSYSIDNGATWLSLNPVNASFSKWKDVLEYNELNGLDVLNGVPFSKVMFDNTELALAGYSAYNSRDIDRNTKYILNIPQLKNETNIRFRFNVGTLNNDGSGNGISEGALIDNFQINEAKVDLLVPYEKNLYLNSEAKKINFSIDVKNIGNYISEVSNISFYLSQDQNYNSGDYQIGTEQLNAIQPDIKQHLILEYDLPQTLSNYNYLIYVIDEIDTNAEINEQNNTGAWPLSLGGIDEFPYLEDFESDVIDGWSGFAYDDYNSTELTNYRVTHKMPLATQNSIVNKRYDGILRTENVPYGSWQSNRTPLYYIYTPTFDFTSTDASEPLFMAFDLMSVGRNNENGSNMEYSLDGGVSWTLLTVNSSPETVNWYPYWAKMSDMNNEQGWFQSDGELKKVKMDISFLQNESSVIFRYKYFSNFATASSAPRGFRLDNFAIASQSLIEEIDCLQNLPYEMDFENYDAPCWFIEDKSPINSNDDIEWELVDNFSNSTSVYSAKIDIYGQGDQDGSWLFSPIFNIQENSVLSINIALTQMGFDTTASLGSDDEVILMYSNNNGENWVPLKTWNINSIISNTGELVQKTISETGGIRFAFRATNGNIEDMTSTTFYISSFSLEEEPLKANVHNESFLKCFPNPVKNRLNVFSEKSPIKNIEVYNTSGQLLLKTKPLAKEYVLDFSSYSSGVYFIKVVSERKSKVFKVIK